MSNTSLSKLGVHACKMCFMYRLMWNTWTSQGSLPVAKAGRAIPQLMSQWNKPGKPSSTAQLATWTSAHMLELKERERKSAARVTLRGCVAQEAARQPQQLLCEGLLSAFRVCHAVCDAVVHRAQPSRVGVPYPCCLQPNLMLKIQRLLTNLLTVYKLSK